MASINGIQVKEYIQALMDEGQIRVEKIGSGNWYWCFGSDEKKAREARLTQLQKEVEKVQAGYDEVGSTLALQGAKREEEEGEANADDGIDGREELLRQKHELEKKVHKVQAEWKAATDDRGNKSIQEKKMELQPLRESAQMWTDNIYVLEEYLNKLAGGDREIMAAVQQECYGEEYVEGEGLRELA